MFSNQLLTDEGRTVGRLDTRYTGPSLDPLAKDAYYDPQAAAISSAYLSVYNDYARNVLKVGGDAKFKLYADVWPIWDFKHRLPGDGQPSQRTLNVMPDLAAAMLTNPRLKVATFSGLFDLATPFFQAEYELSHLPIQPALRANLEIHHYAAGHMMYDDPASLKQLHDDVVRFIRK
jgi:carboxypeptidase C (cathepsin A)